MNDNHRRYRSIRTSLSQMYASEPRGSYPKKFFPETFRGLADPKGFGMERIYFKHILRNVSIPLISVIGVQFDYMLGGSIYIETIFAWPGMGQLLSQAIGWRDFPLVQALAIFTSVVVLALNLATDLAYALLDPRIRYGK